jgi:hypothetical protein
VEILSLSSPDGTLGDDVVAVVEGENIASVVTIDAFLKDLSYEAALY